MIDVLRKRRVELTPEDVETMRTVVAAVLRSTVDPEREAADDPGGPPEWRTGCARSGTTRCCPTRAEVDLGETPPGPRA